MPSKIQKPLNVNNTAAINRYAKGPTSISRTKAVAKPRITQPTGKMSGGPGNTGGPGQMKSTFTGPSSNGFTSYMKPDTGTSSTKASAISVGRRSVDTSRKKTQTTASIRAGAASSAVTGPTGPMGPQSAPKPAPYRVTQYSGGVKPNTGLRSKVTTAAKKIKK